MPTDPVTRIGRSLIISGDLTSDEDVIIEGVVRGYIQIHDAAVTVSKDGVADADIRAARVIVQGTVHGSIAATQRIDLAASAAVEGSLSANRVVIADGARFNGWVDMDRRTIAARLAQYRQTAP